jgi:hypothetical protein
MDKQKHFAAAICLFALPLIFSCSHLSKTGKKPEPPTEFAAMIAKKDELAALPTTEKLSKSPAIKGKLVLVTTHSGTVSLDRFSEKGEAFFSDPPVAGEIYANFLPAELYAKNPEEIETLIKLNCDTKTDSALYTNTETNKDEVRNYNFVICDIDVIDYKTATVIAKTQIGKNEAPKVINKNTLPHTPGLQIAEYLRSIAGIKKTDASKTGAGL